MDLLDLLLLAAAVAAVIVGYRLGFATRVGSWLGLALGVIVGVRVLPWVLGQLQGANRPTMVLVATLVVIGFAVLGQSAGFALSQRVAPRPPPGLATSADRVLGAVAGLVGLAVVVWLVLPLLAAVPGWPADQTSQSRVARLF